MKRQLPCPHALRHACGILVGLTTWGCYAAPALALCPDDDLSVLCDPLLIGDAAPLTQADIDNNTDALTDHAWLLDGATVLRLPAGGAYTPGVPAGLATPTIFVTEDATLLLEDLGTAGVDLNANIVLCDSGTLEIHDSELRFASTQTATFALDESEVVLAGATISGPGAGATTQIFADTASLTATPTAFPSVRSGSGSIQWALGGASTADIADAQLFATLQIGAGTNVSVSNSSYIELLMESCEAQTLAIDGLPEACDLGTNCFGPDHPLTNFSRPAPFAVQVTDAQVFAWRAVSHPGSTTTLNNVPANANLGVDLTGDFGMSTVTFPPGETPEGLDDRTVEVSDAAVDIWLVSPNGASELTIGAGSELGGLTCRGDAVCSVVETTFIDGAAVENREQATLLMDDSTVNGDVLNAGARAEFVTSTLGGNLTMAAPTWLANTTYVAASTSDGGEFHGVELDAPSDGEVVDVGEQLEIRGSVYALEQQGTLRPFPPAVIELRDLDDDETTVLATVESAAEDTLLHTWDTNRAGPGDYEVTLRFATAQLAVERRRVTVLAPAGGTTTGEGSGSTSGPGATSSSEATTEGTAATADTSGDPTASDATSGPGADPTVTPGSDTSGGQDTDGAEQMASAGCRVDLGKPPAPIWALVGLWLVRCRRGRTRIEP